MKELLLRRSGAGASRLVVLLVHAVFQFFLYIILGIIELTDTATQTAHELGDLTAAEKYKHRQDDQEPLTSTRHRNQKIGKHNQRL